MPVGLAGRREEYAAFLLEAEIPALLREVALEDLGAQLEFPRKISTLRERGAYIPLKLNRMGHYALSAVSFGEERSRSVKGPTFFTSYLGWAFFGETSKFGQRRFTPSL